MWWTRLNAVGRTVRREANRQPGSRFELSYVVRDQGGQQQLTVYAECTLSTHLLSDCCLSGTWTEQSSNTAAMVQSPSHCSDCTALLLLTPDLSPAASVNASLVTSPHAFH